MKRHPLQPEIALEPEDLAEVDRKLLRGVMFRTTNMVLIYAATFTVFGLYSYPYIKAFVPDLKLWDNFYPRIFCNTLPLLACYRFFSKAKVSDKFKFFTWVILLPLMLTSASLIQVWPAIISGNPTLFLMVHTTNIFVITFWFLYAAPSFKESAAMLLSVSVFFWIPLWFVLRQTHNSEIVSVFIDDTVCSALLNVWSAFSVNHLRRRLAIEDVSSKSTITKFLGKRVSEAVFENRDELLKKRSQDGFIISMDLRGFTRIVTGMSATAASKFTEEYHRLVNNFVGEARGYIHKTTGDGHLISFGLMDEDVDLGDLPEFKRHENEVKWRRNSHFLERALDVAQKIAIGVEELALEHGILSSPKIGVSIDFGPIEIKIVGATRYRQELDIFGSAVVRAVRLENFTKVILGEQRAPVSILVISDSAAEYLKESVRVELYRTTENHVRDFPEIQNVSYIVLETSGSQKLKILGRVS